MPFANVEFYKGEFPGSLFAILTGPDPVIGVVHFDFMLDHPSLQMPMPVAQFFNLPEQFERCVGIALFYGPALAGVQLTSLTQKLLKDKGHIGPFARKVPGILVWVPVMSGALMPPAAQITTLRMLWFKSEGRSQPAAWYVDNREPGVLLYGANDTSLLWWPSSDVCPIAVAGDDTISFGLSSGDAPSMVFGVQAQGRHAPTACVTLGTASVTVSGIASITGSASQAVGRMPIGIGYPMLTTPTPSSNVGASTSTLFYPLLDLSMDMASTAVSVTLTPLGQQPASLVVALSSSLALPTFYRSTLGKTITLTPTSGACFALQPTADESVLLAPSGAFKLNTADNDAAFDLLCGLSGLEYISASANDTLVFSAFDSAILVIPAAQSGTTPPSLSLGQWTFAQGATWVALSQANPYYTQSQQIPFYTVPDPTPTVLEYALFHVCAGGIPVSTQFPLLPYAGTAAIGSATENMGGFYSTIESHCVAGARCGLLLKAIEEGGGSTSNLTAQTVVTPQKFVAAVETDGTLGSIQFASLGQTSIGFTAETSGALDGLLETQPFYIITSPGSGVTPLGTSLAIGAWTFDLTFPSQTAQPAQPQTILLVKGCGSTLSALVANPAAWTDYADFNNTEADMNGVELSAYLISYFASARQMSASGVAGLETLMQIIDDPTWSGILFLSPPFSSTDPMLNSLFAGIDTSNLYAHHLGISGTTLLSASPYQQSAFFGLIHYVRPGTNPGITASSSPGYVADSLVYDLQVISLQAAFQNSALTSFQSLVWLVMNQVLGDPINGSGSNAIPLAGSAQTDSSGTTTYALTMPSGYIGNFGISGNALAGMQVNSLTALYTGNVATFTLGGFFSLQTLSGFDVMSYNAIAFRSYQLQMTYDASQNQQPAFVEITSSLTAIGLEEAAGAISTTSLPTSNLYRPGSLSSQMPTTVNSLLAGTGQSLPTDMGFTPVNCTPDTGSSSFAPKPKDTWYGLLLDVDLGNDGASGSQTLLTAQMLYAWMPGGNSSPACAVFFRALGPGGISLSFSVENVITLGAKSVTLALAPSGQQFVLSLESIGLTLLGKTFPQQGTADLFIAGIAEDTTRSVGWLGGYVNTHPLT